MKRIKQMLIILLAAVMCISSAACGAGAKTEENKVTDTIQAAIPETPASEAAREIPAEPTAAPEPEPEPEPESEPKPDISAFVGLWKYESIPFYVIISDEYEWTVINMHGEDSGIGAVVAEDDGVSLYSGDSLITSYRKVVGGLNDPSGALLLRADELILLPTPEDPLTETASFSGDFSAVTVDYPRTMVVHPHPSMSNALSFNAAMEGGTEDYYSNIIISFMPISGYDPYMTQGAATATPYMKHMLDGIASSSFGNKLLKSFGSDFKDCGNYYSMTGYLWLDSSIFSGDLTQPVRGCIEVRYYGPVGYALVAITVAMESRIRNYFDICNGMLETCNFTTNWTTAPKPVPTRPTQSTQHSDSGDYGTPYYWYDEDGDVWYWNGYENEFIGFGDDYYIDDDGNYYESNDYGWDPEDYDYYDDYDPWSDPGDGWDDWDDYDDGWDDWDW